MKTEYKVIQSWDIKELTEMVNKELSNGWSLQGGITIGINSKGNIFEMRTWAQAMFRTVEA
jgi:hypothetical protein